MDVADWLGKVLGLPEYSARFKENLINGEMLLTLSDADLATALNITNQDHRKRITSEIGSWRRDEPRRTPRPDCSIAAVTTTGCSRHANPAPSFGALVRALICNVALLLVCVAHLAGHLMKTSTAPMPQVVQDYRVA